ncbi:MAG: MFS transporter [Streptosporangiales bacterium]|nr:MFS transporter [Streptosporangiales bacterium]
MLALAVLAQGVGSVYAFGLAYLVPTFRTELGASLSTAGLLVGAPSAGLMLALVAWGALADRVGDRPVITAGLAGMGILLGCASLVHDPLPLGLLLLAAGAAGAAVHAASGRVVLGWFSARRRGLAMGIRQTGQPVGVAAASLLLPAVAGAAGLGAALLVPAVLSMVAAVLTGVLLRDPPRAPVTGTARAASPYRYGAIWRVHGVSALMVIPQFAVSGYSFVFLVEARHWAPASAGVVLAVTQFAGAASRLLAGSWSDRVASRLGPLRIVAAVNAVTMALLATATVSGSGVVVPMLLAAAVITVSGNGLAFTSVAELAGSAWAGRALGIQNTGQNLTAAATSASIGALIGAAGYGWAFAAVVVFPLLAVFLVPVASDPVRHAR